MLLTVEDFVYNHQYHAVGCFTSCRYPSTKDSNEYINDIISFNLVRSAKQLIYIYVSLLAMNSFELIRCVAQYCAYVISNGWFDLSSISSIFSCIPAQRFTI